jgi:hypothetical protein
MTLKEGVRWSPIVDVMIFSPRDIVLIEFETSQQAQHALRVNNTRTFH